MKTVLNIDAIKDGSIGLDKLSEDTQSQLEKINEIEGKQDKLISGNNIKTINGASILGEGDITISVNEEGLTEILDRVSENEKVTAHALSEIREDLNNIDIPIATNDAIGGVKLGTLLADYNICLAGNSVGNVGININHRDFSVVSDLEVSKSYFNGHNKGKPYRIAPLSFGTPVIGNWYETNLGVPVDSDYFTLNEQGLTIKEGSVSDIKVTWDANSNMNDFKTPGVYEIYGERTVKTDNLPITNDGSGHSFAAKLTVVASTLQPANNEICITQFLQLSNRIGGEGTTYVRTYNENNNSMSGWSAWQKQMGMVETYINSDTISVDFQGNYRIGSDSYAGLNNFIDNGMYSGVYTSVSYFTEGTPEFLETFVLVVINDYAASGQAGLPRHITQLKYAVDAITGQSTVKKRVGTGNDTISWGDWEDIGGGSKKFIRTEENNITLEPNVYYRRIGETSNLNVTLGPIVNPDILNEYFLEFSVTENAQITFPSYIRWANKEVPMFNEPDTIYQVSIVNNLGVYVKF